MQYRRCTLGFAAWLPQNIVAVSAQLSIGWQFAQTRRSRFARVEPVPVWRRLRAL
jgi:hypothetical protein